MAHHRLAWGRGGGWERGRPLLQSLLARTMPLVLETRFFKTLRKNPALPLVGLGNEHRPDYKPVCP
jgi:hypothetical protein